VDERCARSDEFKIDFVETQRAIFKQSKAYTELKARAATLPAFVKAFVAGNWVSLDLGKLLGMLSQFGLSAPSAQQAAALIKAVEAVLGTDVTVTRVGTDSTGDHVRLTAQSKKLLGDLLKAVMTNVPALGAVLGKVDATSIPNHSIAVDAWVKDGSLTKVSLDALQFLSKTNASSSGAALPVVLTFDKSGAAIDKPSGVTPVNLTQLLTLLGGLTGLGG